MITPFFSIVIPLYNKEPYVGKTLDSVLTQTFEDYEVVIVDDGSVDDGPELVRAYSRKDSRINLIRQENAGVSVARNRGIAESSGVYVAFLDADDWWESGHLAELKALACEFPNAGLIGTAFVRKNAQAPHSACVVRSLRGRRGLVNDYFKLVTKSQFIYTSSISVPRAMLIREVTPFPEGVKNGEDLDLWSRLALKYPVAYSGMVTVSYNRAADGQVTSCRHFSLYPLITLGKALEQMTIMDGKRKSVQRYAEHIFFGRALRYAAIGVVSPVEYAQQADVCSWVKQWRNKLLVKCESKIVLKLLLICERLRHSRYIPRPFAPIVRFTVSD